MIEVRLLLERRLPVEIVNEIFLNTTFEIAVAAGCYGVERLFKPEIHTWTWAAQEGKLDVIKWLHDHNKPFCIIETDPMDAAARRGHLDVVKWLHYNRTEGCTPNAMDSAACCCGSLEMIKWLHFNRLEGCTTHAMTAATRSSATASEQFEIIKWLHQNRTESCTNQLLAVVAFDGRTDIVEWVLANVQNQCIELAIRWATMASNHAIAIRLRQKQNSDMYCTQLRC